MIKPQNRHIESIIYSLSLCIALSVGELRAGSSDFDSYAWGEDNYVFGGSKNDDSAVIGPGGPPRVYFNDVWKSSDDGATWQEVTAAAPWEPRAGAAVVVIRSIPFNVSYVSTRGLFPNSLQRGQV